MSNDWSATWNSSVDSGKQRKYRANAPQHQRKQFLSAHLADDVEETVGTSTLPVRTGDRVEVMRGDHAGATGRVAEIDTDDYVVEIDGVERESVDGTETRIPIDPSNLKIVSLNLDDGQRLARYEVSEDEAEDIKVEEVADEDVEEEPEETDEPDEADEDGPVEEEEDMDDEAEGDDMSAAEQVVEGTVEEVKDAVRDGDIDAGSVLAAERENKNRVTLVEWLEGRTGDDDE